MPDARRPIRRALITVYDKTGVVEFCRALHDEFGIELISTGGTARSLGEAGLPVTLVENVTGFPEMLDGRVKTLHPKIHAAILADRDNPEHMRQLAEANIEPIDMVVVNLYPFERTIADPDCSFEQAIEMIDVGGPCLLRAAAKNHRGVLVVPGVDSYGLVLAALRGDGLETRRRELASMAFHATYRYDSAVSSWVGRLNDGSPMWRHIHLLNRGPLRYGENPHQAAELLGNPTLLPGLNLSSTKAIEDESGQTGLSFNNYLDANAALDLCAELTRASHERCGCGTGVDAGATPATATPATSNVTRASGPDYAAVFIKHTNACGVGLGNSPLEAYRRAYLGDPNAAMGGILAVNFPVNAEFAATVINTLKLFGDQAAAAGCTNPPRAFFAEVIVAPSFDDDAVEIIRGRVDGKSGKTWGERVRLLAVGDMQTPPDHAELDIRRIAGGVLMQTPDLLGLNESDWKIVTKRQPTPEELADMRLAWLTCKHTRSNAISICKDGMLIGNGAGQMSRVMSCRIAVWLARENGHGSLLAGSVAASDAFFPFSDGPDNLIDAGVRAIIQPGGSKRDAETIAACDERDVAMIFTDVRHFRH